MMASLNRYDKHNGTIDEPRADDSNWGQGWKKALFYSLFDNFFICLLLLFLFIYFIFNGEFKNISHISLWCASPVKKLIWERLGGERP